jgi:hypothetical protein
VSRIFVAFSGNGAWHFLDEQIFCLHGKPVSGEAGFSYLYVFYVIICESCTMADELDIDKQTSAHIFNDTVDGLRPM